MMKRVNNLNEEILPKEKKNKVINDFILFVEDKINLDDEDLPRMVISYDEKEAQTMKSFGRYDPKDNTLRIVAVNRNLADILRTLAHELIHCKQRTDGKLKPNSGETGSEEENEANALAGELMREFGKNNPIIFE